MRILFYVTGHGYGHATRMRALAAALRARLDGRLSLEVRTQAPFWFFADGHAAVHCTQERIDVGILQPDCFDLDLPATLAAHEDFLAGWDAAVEREAAHIREGGFELVVGDVPALAFAAAARAGIRSAAVANFGWDWILRRYAPRDARWGRVADRYAAAYAEAGTAYRLPLSGPLGAFPSVVETPLLVGRSRLCRSDAKGRLGLSPYDPRPVVLLSFGGMGSGPLDLSEGADLSGFRFVGFGKRPRGLRAHWTGVMTRRPGAHLDLVAACDGAIGKPGYGMISECIAHRTRLSWLPREDFEETPALIEGLDLRGIAAPMPREDFARGRWRAHLERLFALPDRWPSVPLDGAAFIASHLVSDCSIR